MKHTLDYLSKLVCKRVRMHPHGHKAKISRKAFEDTFSVIAKTGLDIIIADLEASDNYGEDLDEEILAQCLCKFFGDAGGGFLLLRIKIRNTELLRAAEIL